MLVLPKQSERVISSARGRMGDKPQEAGCEFRGLILKEHGFLSAKVVNYD